MARKVLRNLVDPLVRLRSDLKRLAAERERLADEIRRHGDVDGARERRLDALEGESRRLRAAANETMRQRHVMGA